MEPLELYGWVAAAAAAPLQVTLAVAAMALLHAGRARWRTVDLFLVAVVSQQLLAALLALGYSLLRLMRPDVAAACAAFAWGWTAVRVLQASTVASMAADRVLTAQWPYKYRYSVRRNQIRYHIGVLTTVAVLVGTAALFSAGGGDEDAGARTLLNGVCSFLPYHINLKYSVFLLALHVLLALVAAASLLTVQILLCLRPRLRHAHSDLNPLNHTTSDTSTSSRSGGAPRYGALSANNTLAASGIATLPHPANRRRKRAVRRLSDFRWPTVALVTVLCYLVNHLPYLALLVFGTFLPGLLPAYLPVEALTVWTSLAEGILLTPLLLCVDPALRGAVQAVYRRRDDKHPDGGHPYRAKEGLSLGSPADTKFPITNGSLFSLQDAARTRHLKMGLGALEPAGGDDSAARPRYLPTLFDPALGRSPPALDPDTTRTEPLYSDPIQRSASLDSIIKCLPPAEEPIYATLSTGRTTPERCNSVTTVANDDFEFRASKRFCNGPRRPEEGQPLAAAAAAFSKAESTQNDQLSIRSTTSGVTIRVEAPAPPPRPSLQRIRGDASAPGGPDAGCAPGKRKMALSMNDLDVVGVVSGSSGGLVREQRRAGSVPSCRMSCYGVPCRSETDLAAAAPPQPSLRRRGELAAAQVRVVRASPRGTAQRVMRYKRSSPRRRPRGDAAAAPRALLLPRPAPSLLSLNEMRGEIVSVEALNQAMALTPYSYLDNGEVYRHHSRSVPDFQKVFISGFL